MASKSPNKFNPEVIEKLNHYVYRLIDPRNGETFYVGKGNGNRVFAHVNLEAGLDGDDISNKTKRIREIKIAGFDVDHVIHRHGMDSSTAFEVEADLIDAYPGLTNMMDGAGNSEYGVMHALEVINQYGAEPAVFNHKVLMITVNRGVEERDSLYEAVRYAWKLSKKKAEEADYVLAVVKGVIKGAYKPSVWLDATPENFPEYGSEAREGRIGFIGEEAPAEIGAMYVGKRIPDELRRPGAANPVRYSW